VISKESRPINFAYTTEASFLIGISSKEKIEEMIEYCSENTSVYDLDTNSAKKIFNSMMIMTTTQVTKRVKMSDKERARPER